MAIFLESNNVIVIAEFQEIAALTQGARARYLEYDQK